MLVVLSNTNPMGVWPSSGRTSLVGSFVGGLWTANGFNSHSLINSYTYVAFSLWTLSTNTFNRYLSPWLEFEKV